VTKLAHDGPQKSPHPRCAQGQGQGQRSRYTGTSVMSRNVWCTVRSDVLSLHALTLWNTIILSFQYKYQAAVYILEWATPSLTVWLLLPSLLSQRRRYCAHSIATSFRWGKIFNHIFITFKFTADHAGERIWKSADTWDWSFEITKLERLIFGTTL